MEKTVDINTENPPQNLEEMTLREKLYRVFDSEELR
jgi:hypothetical protein